MKKSTIGLTSPARWLLAGSLFVGGLGIAGTFAPQAQAQNPARGARRKGLSKKVLAAVSEKTGKPITPDMRQKLMAMAKTRDDAIEAANTKFYVDFAAATGLTIDQVKEITTPQRGAGAGAGGKRGGGAMAPVPPPTAGGAGAPPAL